MNDNNLGQEWAAIAPGWIKEVHHCQCSSPEAYSWFDLTTIPYDGSKYIEVDGMVYHEVTQPGITSPKALTAYLNA